MIRKIFAEPAIAILTVAIAVAFYFIVTNYQQKVELVAQVGKLEKQLEDLANLQVGDVVPPLELTDAQGKPDQLIYRAGEKQLLMIFSPACAACKLQEAAIWNRLADQVKGKGCRARGLLLGRAETLRPFLQDHPFQFEVLVSDTTLLKRIYRINKIPQLVLLNGTGKVELIHYGILDETGLIGFLRQVDQLK